MSKVTTFHSLVIASTVALTAFLPMKVHALDQGMIDFFTTKVIEHTCSDRGAWLRCYQLNPSACSSAMEAAIRPCATQVLEPLPTVTNNEKEAMNTALAFQKCFNTRFEKIFARKRLDTSECREGPAHLKDTKKPSSM
jgi:hypothetical protein